MKTNENKNNESAATAKVESAKVENESNESESKQEATEATATEPTAEQIAKAKVLKKHEAEINRDYKIDLPKEVEKTKFAGAYVLGVWRAPKDVKKNGDKTFFKIYFNGTIYDGYTSTEFCDEIGIERKHRDCSKSAPKAITLLDKLQALKNAIEAVGSEEDTFVNFAKIVAQKIESEQIECERAEFVAKYAAAIALFAEITEAICAKIYGADVLELAKKLGYKFSDTTDTNESK